MVEINGTENGWGSRRTYLLVLLCQIIGNPMFAVLPHVAISIGATGSIVAYLLSYFFLGLPLLYMEFIISQFTARDCINIWKARPCLSHIGYVLVIWQVFSIIYNHINNSFTFHYLIISFEHPIPYFTCGFWSTSDCNIQKYNITVNEECVRSKHTPIYCDNLYTTFPEYQYWKRNLLGVNKAARYHIAWRVCLASGIVCIITYLCCIKRKRSFKLVVGVFTIYPILGYLFLLLGSMLQKGVLVIYEEALDSHLKVFCERFRVSLLVTQVVLDLGIGSGFIFNLNSSSAFRAPCYANTVIAVVSCAAASTLAVCATAVMACPYSYEHGINPYRIIRANMALVYEKIPRLLFEYQWKYLWLVLVFSCQASVGLSSNALFVLHMFEILASRNSRAAQYPGILTLLGVTLLYVLTIPLLGHVGLSMMLGIRRFLGLVTTFIVTLETLVFIIWYGIDKFTEDVHFMQGLQPKIYMKAAWLGSGIMMLYVFCCELYIKFRDYRGTLNEKVGWIAFIISMSAIICVCLLKLIIAASKNKFADAVRLDMTWGPRNEVLQRSRAMFTAQAMTKEYLYRQYHLQAGMLMRQKMANCRNVTKDVEL